MTEAAGGAEALRRMDRHEFDLILCDLSMPQGGALALLTRLRARSPEVPVVLALDTRDNRTAIEAARLGAFQYLVKPIAPKELEETAANAVRLRRSGRHTLAVFAARARVAHREVVAQKVDVAKHLRTVTQQVALA